MTRALVAGLAALLTAALLSLAWDKTRWTNTNIGEFTRLWAAREFGAEHPRWQV